MLFRYFQTAVWALSVQYSNLVILSFYCALKLVQQLGFIPQWPVVKSSTFLPFSTPFLDDRARSRATAPCIIARFTVRPSHHVPSPPGSISASSSSKITNSAVTKGLSNTTNDRYSSARGRRQPEPEDEAFAEGCCNPCTLHVQPER